MSKKVVEKNKTKYDFLVSHAFVRRPQNTQAGFLLITFFLVLLSKQKKERRGTSNCGQFMPMLTP
jgi:hypothetical protein